MGRVVIAGIGNIFLGDDGFGPAVIDHLRSVVPDGIELADTGIRALHLAMDVADDCDAVVLVDVAELRATPGTVELVEPPGDLPDTAADPHAIDAAQTIALIRRLASPPPRILLVGCQPEQLEPAAPLSATVTAAIEPAARLAVDVAVALRRDPTHDFVPVPERTVS